jgi:parallel beta-helix repeat protein
LKALNYSNEALILSGSGSSVSNFVMVSGATTRLDTPQSAMIYANNASNYVVKSVLINGSSSVGIFSLGCNNGQILNNTVENTRADSISQSNGSYNITISGNRIVNSGDDGVSNNSYSGEPGGMVHGITVQGNTVLNNKGGRGIEVSGGSDITFTGNYVDNTDGYTDMYIASELAAYNTMGVDNVTVTGNTFVDGGPNQGSLLVYNSQGSTYNITNITVSGNQFVNPKTNAVQYTGNGMESGVVQNNTAYTSNPFSSSSNTNVTPTMSNNTVLSPSTFSTPLVAPGGGCGFSGC